MIDYYKRDLEDEKLRKLESFENGCWINVIDPTPEEIDFLSIVFNLDKQNLLSGLDQNEVPRVEFDNDINYIILKTIDSQKNLNTFLIIITNVFILTLSKNKIGFLEKIFEGKKEFITIQRLKCLLGLLSILNKEFEKSTLDIVRSVNTKKESFDRLTDKDITILLDHESILNNFVSFLYYNVLLYERILKHIKFSELDKEIIEDLQIEAQQGFDLCKSSLKTISNIRNHYVILLSNKLNKVINLLTIFTIFLSIPTVISGIYGMNVLLPFQEGISVFYYIIIFVLILWVLLLAYFKKMKII